MSALPDNEFDLEKLFLPAWAQQPSSGKSYADYEGGEDRPDRRTGRDHRPPRRDRPPGQRRDDRGTGENRGRGRPEGGRGGQSPRGEWRGPRRDAPPAERREPALPLPDIDIEIAPESKGTESLARQIRVTGRAYPLFDIARLILQKPDRYTVTLTVRKNAEGAPVQPMFVCGLDDTLWLSEADAIAHVLKHHFGTFYQAERAATEPPKGKYTFVAQCGISGVILGPPNHHDYQVRLHKLHTERFSRMPFDDFKARVRIVRDEEVVKKWVEEQSWKTEYVCLNVSEPLKLQTLEQAEKHFRETHKDAIIKPLESKTFNGSDTRTLRSPELGRLVRQTVEDQRRFPLRLATLLSQQFGSHGLQFFKVNKTITHVWVARPHFLDLEVTPVSEGIKSIVNYVNSHPRCTRKHLVAALAPTPAAQPPPSPAPVAAAPAEPAPPEAGQPPPTAPQAPAQPAAPPASPEPTPEQTALVSDLHWLIHQGHVIEFANGVLETAKRPLPRPPKPAPKAGETAKPVESAPAEESAAADEEAPTAVVPPAEAIVEAPQVEAAPQGEAAPHVEAAAQVPEPPVERPAETETPPVSAPNSEETTK